MTIELTAEQAQAVAAEGNDVILIDPRTKDAYRLIREELFKKVQALMYDDSPWTPSEMARCPNCRAVISEKTPVEPRGGIEVDVGVMP